MYPTDALDAQVQKLQHRVHEAESQLRNLKHQLQQAEAEAAHAHQHRIGQNLEIEWQEEVLAALGHNIHQDMPARPQWSQQEFALSGDEYKRFGRQLIMPEIGLRGQLRLKNTRVLIVGAGGLGCPAAAYLAGAGVGTLGLIDGDTVEVSNLHRQIAHSTQRLDRYKVDSAIEYLSGLNPNVNYIPYRKHLTPHDALEIFSQYDIVLDCTDHPTSRYLISDACVLAGNPLVSASALRTEGQLTVLNNPPRAPGSTDGGPCYRCVFPKPPPAESVISCGEGGILGPVVGVMGVLQALEAIKLIANGIDFGDRDEESQPPSPMSDGMPSQPQPKPAPSPSLLLFSAYSTPQFRNVRLRSRRKDCASCSSEATITPSSLTSGSIDYIAFCGTKNEVDILSPADRLSATELAALARTKPDTVLLDVRDATEFELCSLPGSINIPWNGFAEKMKENEEELQMLQGRDVVVVCKLGNDSQLAAKILKEMNGGRLNIKDVRGGLRAWRDEVDPTWPDY
ncbi:hypothetical protein BDV97DRAFT_341144 [Delphinella strobiligena]|nr:hypothetical protein BDV97DRAFT_341144 [Delphinella strobiligena]